MDKRREANLRVRRAITDALFGLMEQKPLASITVSEAARAAGVSRLFFYRNYESREDVIRGYIRDVLDDFSAAADYDLADCMTVKHVRRTLEYFRLHRSHVLNIHDSGYSSIFLDELNQYHALTAGDMPAKSVERYKVFVFTGAMYNVAVNWLKEDDPAPPSEVARVFLGFTADSSV